MRAGIRMGAVSIAVLAACSGNIVGPPADSGHVADAGIDSGADGGGTGADSGTGADAGRVDAGKVDAGAGADSGGAEDAGADTRPPALSGGSPSGTLPSGTTSATLQVITDEPATCRWDLSASTPYSAMSNAFAATGGAQHTAPISGLSDGQSYAYYVRCADAAGNASAAGYPVTFRVAGGTANILWRDDLQTSSASPWGFDGLGVEHPIGTEVAPGDANGANLSRVLDPLLGGGFALRHFATFDAGGSRAQAGIYGDVNTAFGAQAKRPEGVWVAQEWYFPSALTAGGDYRCWINLWDWHSIDANRGNRWHTSPGLILARDGSMKVRWEWGGAANSINDASQDSAIALPVGRWFDVEMHYVWSAAKDATLSLWIDGQLALEQSGVQTRANSHQVVETYVKFYGSTQDGPPWSPTPSVRYTRNVRVAGERIWR